VTADNAELTRARGAVEPTEKQLIQPGEECIDIIVDIITLLSVAKFDQTTHNVVLELIKDRASPEYRSPLTATVARSQCASDQSRVLLTRTMASAARFWWRCSRSTPSRTG
jgi:hypothetical protein